MLPAYSPAVDRAKPTGINPIAVTSVPASIGAAVWLQAYAAALVRSRPSSSFTTIISMAMIASSTRRPSARMSAPKRDAIEDAARGHHDHENGGKGQGDRGGDHDADHASRGSTKLTIITTASATKTSA